MQQEGTEQERRFEVKNEGDVIEISLPGEEIADIGAQVYKALGGEDWTLEQATEVLRKGKELRPKSLAVYISGGKLFVDTRNFRGDSQKRQMILDAVKSSIE